MKTMLGTLLLGLLLVAAPAFAANVDGDWSGSLDTDNGPVQLSYTFKADGAKLSGTTTGPDGAKLTIKNGKVDGDNISFTVDVDMGGNAMTLNYKGLVSADGIAMTLDFQGMPVKFNLKRAAKQT
ncbi:MAG TPA: hypothetical protein VGG49_01565 [Steroidobacteraceae bacterium]|jgi:hypothetical protein